MGKGYANFMSKKSYHPAACSNQRRIREAEEKAEQKRKYDEESAAQYRREQELYHQKRLITGDKDKLDVNFVYDPPPGYVADDKRDKMQFKDRTGKVKTDDEVVKLDLKWERGQSSSHEKQQDTKINLHTTDDKKISVKIEKEEKKEPDDTKPLSKKELIKKYQREKEEMAQMRKKVKSEP